MQRLAQYRLVQDRRWVIDAGTRHHRSIRIPTKNTGRSQNNSRVYMKCDDRNVDKASDQLDRYDEEGCVHSVNDIFGQDELKQIHFFINEKYM